MPNPIQRTTRKPRLLFVIRLLAGRRGGAERVFVTLSNVLAERGYAVTAAYCDGKSDPPGYSLTADVQLVNLWNQRQRDNPFYRLARKWGGRWLPFGLSNVLAWMGRYLPFVRDLRKLIGRLEPALVISFLPSANTVTLVACLGQKTKVLCTNHNLPASDYASAKRWDPNPFDRFLRKALLYRANRVSVLFSSYKSFFGSNLAPKMLAIPNFLEPQFFERTLDGPRRKRIIASGRLSWEKNFETLIEAFAGLGEVAKEYELWIFGEGTERGSLEALIGKLGVADRIFLPGHEADMRTQLREGFALCHPAHFEGFALSVAEALAQGLPVVAFRDCSGVNEYVVDEENGLLVDRALGAKGFASALERLISDPTLWNHLSENAPRSVEQFREQNVLPLWERVIDELTCS